MADYCMVIPDPCIRLPTMVRACLLRRESFLEVGYAFDLSRHQHHIIEQKRWAALLDDSDTFTVEVGMAGRRHVNLVTSWKYYLALTPHIGMQDKRHPGPPNALNNPFESAVMIGVPMREYDGAQVVRSHFEHVHIVLYGFTSQSSIIKHRFATTFALYSQKQRVAVFGNQLLTFSPVAVKRRSLSYLVARHENVEGIIHQDCDVGNVNWQEGDMFAHLIFLFVVLWVLANKHFQAVIPLPWHTESPSHVSFFTTSVAYWECLVERSGGSGVRRIFASRTKGW